MLNTIPDSIDLLNLNGIMPYDVKTFIKEGKQTTLSPQKKALEVVNGVSSNDQFIPSDNNSKINKKGVKKPGLYILGASLVFLAFTIARKKFPNIQEALSKMIKKP